MNKKEMHDRNLLAQLKDVDAYVLVEEGIDDYYFGTFEQIKNKIEWLGYEVCAIDHFYSKIEITASLENGKTIEEVIFNVYKLTLCE